MTEQTLGDMITAEGGPLYIKLEEVMTIDFESGNAKMQPSIRVGVYDETPGGRPKPPRWITPEILAVKGQGFPEMLRIVADELERFNVTGRGDG